MNDHPPVSPAAVTSVGQRAITQLRRVAGHEWTIAAAAAVVLSLVLNRGALADLRHTLPRDIWDPSLVAYLIAWDGHALLHYPGSLWDLNAFYPAPYSLAYTDSMLGYGPFAIVGTGPETAVLRYNVIFIGAEALVLFGGYVLTRQLGLGRFGAALVGVAIVVAPWRLSQTGHLQVLSTGGMFLALAMLARGHGICWRRSADTTDTTDTATPARPGWVLAGWLAASWQLTIGFGVGLPFVYVLLGCLVFAAIRWAVRRQSRPSPMLLLANGAGGLVFAGTALLMARPYLKVLELYPYTKRDISWVELYSAPLSGLFTAPVESTLWGEAHTAARAGLTVPGEMSLLPGFLLYALAAAGLIFSVWPPRTRLALAGGAVAMLACSLGTNGPADGALGYRLLLNLPGFEGIRTPGRLMVWATLLLALLAAGALCAIVALVREATELRGRSRPSWLAQVALTLPIMLVLIEGLGTIENARVPPAPPTLSTVAAPYLVLPTHEVMDMNVMLWSTDRFADVVNGGSGVVPAEVDQIRRAAATFPDAASVAYLRRVGVRSVVVQPERMYGSPLAKAATIPIDGLGITREIYPDVVVFTL